MSLSRETRFRIRALLIAVIIATIPCYCAGIFLVNQASSRPFLPTYTSTAPANLGSDLSPDHGTPSPPTGRDLEQLRTGFEPDNTFRDLGNRGIEGEAIDYNSKDWDG